MSVTLKCSYCTATTPGEDRNIHIGHIDAWTCGNCRKKLDDIKALEFYCYQCRKKTPSTGAHRFGIQSIRWVCSDCYNKLNNKESGTKPLNRPELAKEAKQ